MILALLALAAETVTDIPVVPLPPPCATPEQVLQAAHPDAVFGTPLPDGMFILIMFAASQSTTLNVAFKNGCAVGRFEAPRG